MVLKAPPLPGDIVKLEAEGVNQIFMPYTYFIILTVFAMSSWHSKNVEICFKVSLLYSIYSSPRLLRSLQLPDKFRICYSGNSISSFIFTKPYFSYKGRPIAVASKEIEVIPLHLVSLISIFSVLYAIPILL